MKSETLEELNRMRRDRQAAILVTRLNDAQSWIYGRGEPVGEEMEKLIQSAFQTGKSRCVEVEGEAYFINAYLPPPRIAIIGAVHISQALVPMARIAGFDCLIVDPRTAFASRERFPDVDVVADWPQDVLQDRPLDGFTALIAITHDPKIDDYPLQEALQKGCFYVGALGSRKTHARRVERLHRAGLSQSDIDRIRAPIGLDIGASTPAEIAVAILAEIIEALRTRKLPVRKKDLAA